MLRAGSCRDGHDIHSLQVVRRADIQAAGPGPNSAPTLSTIGASTRRRDGAAGSNGRQTRGRLAWPFRLVRIDDDGHGGGQGLLHRRHGLGRVGGVGARQALYLVHHRKGRGRGADGPAGGGAQDGGETGLDRICRRQRRGRCRRPRRAPGRSRPRPPTDVANISRFSVFTDPQTARLALFKWLGAAQEQPTEPDAPGHVGWRELLAADGEQALAFYSELFGWQKADDDIDESATYQLFSAGGETIGGMVTKPETIPAPFWLFYFNAGDVDAAAQRVKAGGGRIVEGPIEVPGGSCMVWCEDPQGGVFALEGTQQRKPVGYFERVAPRNPANARSRRWSW